MPHPRIVAVALLPFLILSIASCQKSTPPSSATPLTSTPDAVRGTINLRDRDTFPPGATLRVVARWYGTKMGEQLLQPTGGWPVTFAVPLEWPKGKGEYSDSLGVYATAELNGRVLMVTDEKYADPPPDPAPVNLLLIPTVE